MRAALYSLLVALLVLLLGCSGGRGSREAGPSVEEQKRLSIPERTQRAKQDLLPPSQLGIGRKGQPPAGGGR